MLSKRKIKELLTRLNKELNKEQIVGEIYLLGGAVMCLVFRARESTQDVDAFFKPAKAVREAAKRIAQKEGIQNDWLNDGVKGYLSDQASFQDFLELSNLKIYSATPEYLLAMKCIAMRIGEEFHDLADVRYLIRYLNLESYDQVLEIVKDYYPLDRIPQKTFYVLEELFEKH